MLPPKEFAKELRDQFFAIVMDTNLVDNGLERSKQCALIAIDKIIFQWEYIDTYLANLGGQLNPNLKYYQEVKIELEKL